ncbi:hypothetical protein HDE_09106 [Halotydeus destructor]|nr:hypothetical protein HDE_09106 [Halotydeus destructor]
MLFSECRQEECFICLTKYDVILVFILFLIYFVMSTIKESGQSVGHNQEDDSDRQSVGHSDNNNTLSCLNHPKRQPSIRRLIKPTLELRLSDSEDEDHDNQSNQSDNNQCDNLKNIPFDGKVIWSTRSGSGEPNNQSNQETTRSIFSQIKCCVL